VEFCPLLPSQPLCEKGPIVTRFRFERTTHPACCEGNNGQNSTRFGDQQHMIYLWIMVQLKCS